MSKLLEDILDDENIQMAMRKVISNKGTFGVDKMSLGELEGYLKEHLEEIKNDIRHRTFQPNPVRRVEIPKPNGNGVRKLGIPTVVDRTIQQAIVQVLSPIFEDTFSEYSYGFRPNRSCQNAITKALEYLNLGYGWIVDIDLEKFFDNVPQDKLMSYVNRVIHDGDVESLIRRYLQAGVMDKGKLEKSDLGTPQGGNLSPLLSNIMLTELDKELESRGLGFTRYADDCIILVKSEASAKRVMSSITKFIEQKLGLKVNATKTHITKPTKLKYLGFSFWKDTSNNTWKARPHEDSVRKYIRKLKSFCKRSWSVDLSYRIAKLNEVTRGWINYFRRGSMKQALTDISSHLRTMLRVIIWKQWKVPSKRQWGLQKLGANKDLARLTSHMGDHYQWVCTKTCVVRLISKEKLVRKGLVDPLDYYLKQANELSELNRQVPNGMPGGVRGT